MSNYQMITFNLQMILNYHSMKIVKSFRLVLDQDQYVQLERKRVLDILNYLLFWSVLTMHMDYLHTSYL